MKIILGSGSPKRKTLLAEMGYEFEVIVSNFDEKSVRIENPKELTLALAKAKADALLPQIAEPALLITLDQVVVCNGEIYEKPENAEEARRQLKSYASHPAQAVNAVVVTNTKTGKRVGANAEALVYFKPIPDEAIEQLIERGEIFMQAGAFSVRDPIVASFVEKIEGTEDIVEGLPKALIERLLREAS